jgi:hypothetical protein
MKKISIVTLFVISLLIFFSVAVLAAERRVLLISSYHPGFPTFFKQIEGIGQGTFNAVRFYISVR